MFRLAYFDGFGGLYIDSLLALRTALHEGRLSGLIMDGAKACAGFSAAAHIGFTNKHLISLSMLYSYPVQREESKHKAVCAKNDLASF